MATRTKSFEEITGSELLRASSLKVDGDSRTVCYEEAEEKGILHFYNYTRTDEQYNNYCSCGKHYTTIRGVLNHIKREVE